MQFTPTLRAIFSGHDLVRLARWFPFFACWVLPGSLFSASSEIYESHGTMTIERFGHQGEVMRSVTHDYSLASSEQGFRIRAMNSWDGYEQGMLVVSDGKSLYQANRITKAKASGKPTIYSLAKFDYRRMPAFETYGWGPMQALTLANYLLRAPDKILDGNELRAEYIPELIATRGREVNKSQIRTQFFAQNGGQVMRIIFWGLEKGAKGPSLVEGARDCMILGELRIDRFEKSLPTQMHFVINGLHVESPDPKQPRKPSPLAAVSFEGKISPSDPSVLNEISYDAGVASAVRDSRFPNVKELSYTLKDGDLLPFDADPAAKPANVAQQAYATLTETRNISSRKRYMVLGTISVSVLALIAVLSVRSNLFSNKSTAHHEKSN